MADRCREMMGLISRSIFVCGRSEHQNGFFDATHPQFDSLINRRNCEPVHMIFDKRGNLYGSVAVGIALYNGKHFFAGRPIFDGGNIFGNGF